jgi:hypothetical protein
VDVSRLSRGELIAAASGVALFLFLFLPWYHFTVDIAGLPIGSNRNAWEAFGAIDVLLFLIAVVAVGVPVARAAGSLPSEFPVALVLLAVGGLGLLLVLYRLIDLPTPDVPLQGNDTVDVGRRIGVLMGLLATAGIAYGGWRAGDTAAAAR